MKRITPLLFAAGAVLAAPFVMGQPHTIHQFRKIQLSDTFFSEGATFGDFNNDGVMDVASGPYWYEGPGFQKRHEIYPPKPFDPKGYSDCFLMFVHDFDQDGWNDILIVGFPGAPAYWYQNPRGEKGHWARHLVADDVGNESPLLADLDGDGQPELIYNTSTHLGYARYDKEKPTAPWTFIPVSPAGAWNKFTHGLGIGDVNGNGRMDILTHQAWWEQPESLEQKGEWTRHPIDLGPGGAQMFSIDVDGDGVNDIVTSIQAHGWGLAWYRQNGAAAFEQQLIMGEKHRDSRYGVRFSQPHALALADMDGSGSQGIITGKRFWAHGPEGDPEPNAPSVLYWFKPRAGEDGAIEFVPFLIDDDSGVGTQVVAGDISGNGFPDVVIGNKKGTFIFLNEPTEVTAEEWEKAQPKVIMFHRAQGK